MVIIEVISPQVVRDLEIPYRDQKLTGTEAKKVVRLQMDLFEQRSYMPNLYPPPDIIIAADMVATRRCAELIGGPTNAPIKVLRNGHPGTDALGHKYKVVVHNALACAQRIYGNQFSRDDLQVFLKNTEPLNQWFRKLRKEIHVHVLQCKENDVVVICGYRWTVGVALGIGALSGIRATPCAVHIHHCEVERKRIRVRGTETRYS